MLQRLDKILAGSGLLTRSQAKEALRAGRVQVDGVPARDGAAKVAKRAPSQNDYLGGVAGGILGSPVLQTHLKRKESHGSYRPARPRAQP